MILGIEKAIGSASRLVQICALSIAVGGCVSSGSSERIVRYLEVTDSEKLGFELDLESEKYRNLVTFDVPSTSSSFWMCDRKQGFQCFSFGENGLRFAIPSPYAGQSEWHFKGNDFRIEEIIVNVACGKTYVIASYKGEDRVGVYMFNSVTGLRSYGITTKIDLLVVEGQEHAFSSFLVADGLGFAASGSCR